MLKWLILLILLSSSTAYARLYCAQDISGCHEMDYACQMSKQLLKNIFDSQEKWSEFFTIDNSSEDLVSFKSDGKHCRHLNFTKSVMAEISINVLIDTKTHKKYEVHYTGCGAESFFTEHWEIKGKNLKPLNKFEKRNIYLHKKRTVSLVNNEDFKDFYLTSNVNRYKVPEKYFSFGSIHANVIYRSTYSREKSSEISLAQNSKVVSKVWLFDKQLFTQTTNLHGKNSYKFYFESPIYSFAKRWRSRFDPCFRSEVIFSRDKYGKELIRSSKSSRKFGLPYETFKENCGKYETLRYLDRAKELFVLFFEKHIPKFSSDVAEDKNKKLRKEIEEIITFIESGDTVITLDKMRQLLQDVKNEKILDAR